MLGAYKKLVNVSHSFNNYCVTGIVLALEIHH